MTFPNIDNVLTIFMKDGSQITSATVLPEPFNIERTFSEESQFGICMSNVDWMGKEFSRCSLIISIDQISAIHRK